MAIDQEQTEITGARALLNELKNQGVKRFFGYPGGAVLGLYNELYHEEDLLHILVRHEQGGCHAADGYARVSGKPGVVLATSGPGGTNLVTGIANAYMDSIPIVCLTGQVPTFGIGTDFFQEADITGITIPIVKHSYLVKKPQDIVKAVAHAFYISKTGRPGPTLIDMPKDVLAIKLSTADQSWQLPSDYKPNIKGYKPKIKGNPKQIQLAAQKIIKARRPVLYVGGGVISAGASSLVLKLADQCMIPITTTLMAKGAVPYNHPLYMGMLGMHGTAYSNFATYNSDLLIAVGARFDDRVTGKLETFAPDAEVIHIDIDPAEIGKNRRMAPEVDIPIVGDAKNILEALIAEIKGQQANSDEWISKIEEWKEEYPLDHDPISERDATLISPQCVFKAIAKYGEKKVIYSTDVGQHQMWSAQYAQIDNPNQWLTSGGAGTMGFGLPAAMGGVAALKDSEGSKNDRSSEIMVNITGDGSFQMCIQELGTIKAYDLPVINCIFNNKNLGMVRQWQDMFYDKQYSHIDLKHGTPDFLKVSEAYGIKAARPSSNKEMQEVLQEALTSEKDSWVIDIPMEYEMNVWPIVPPGGSNMDMMGAQNCTMPDQGFDREIE